MSSFLNNEKNKKVVQETNNEKKTVGFEFCASPPTESKTLGLIQFQIGSVCKAEAE
jgi:hypothetical protein